MKTALRSIAITALLTLFASSAFAAPPRSTSSAPRSTGGGGGLGDGIALKFDFVGTNLGANTPVFFGYASDQFVFLVGLNFNYTIPDDDDADNTMGLTLEPTLRYYLESPAVAKLSPFLEGELTLGTGSDEVPTVFGLGGGVGVAYYFNPNFGLSGMGTLRFANTEDVGSTIGIGGKASVEFRF